jgi:hypothetical protein
MSCNNDTTNSSEKIIYYKHVNQTICNISCPDGQFIKIGIPNSCQVCSI